MGLRTWTYAVSNNADTGETNGGGGSSQFLIYQTAQSTPPETLIGGTGVGMVMGPDESSRVVACYANSAVNSTGANGVAYDITFYGASSGASEEVQVAPINAAVKQADDDGIDVSGLGGYPYTGDPDGAGQEVNSDSSIPVTISKDNAILS